jgi:hypothetical protein
MTECDCKVVQMDFAHADSNTRSLVPTRPLEKARPQLRKLGVTTLWRLRKSLGLAESRGKKHMV